LDLTKQTINVSKHHVPHCIPNHLSPIYSSVQPIKPVEKIHLEVNAGPGRHPINARQLLETLRRLSKVSVVRRHLLCVGSHAHLHHPF
jgi:hypothetical protein